jgi:hypothetical protein
MIHWGCPFNKLCAFWRMKASVLTGLARSATCGTSGLRFALHQRDRDGTFHLCQLAERIEGVA